MFRHTSRLQFESKPDQPDPVYAHKLQELIGGAYGEMTVTMQYLFQGWNCRMPGKYKDLIMDIATEEIGHVEMIATMVARLLEGAPATATTKAAAADPVVGAVLGGMDPQQAIVSGGGALLADSNGYPWNGRYIVASGTLQAEGLETTVAPNALFEEEYAEHATAIWHLSDGTSGQDGSWATGLQPDGQHEFGHLADPQPLGDVASVPAPDPLLYATYDGAMGEPKGPVMGTETGLAGKIKDALS